jgi:predicted N-acyltransferase
VRGVVELAGQRSAAACGVLYLPRQAAAVAAILGDLGFVRFPLTERAVLDIPPGGLAGYLRSLPGHRRRNVRRELRILAEAGVVSRTADPGAAVDVILRLRLTHLSSLGLPADAAAERARLDGLVRNFPGSVLRLIVSEVRGRPVACMMFARTGPVLHGVMMGVDYRHAPPFTIFEALYYAVIRAAEPGVTALDLGIGHLDAKLRRGATPRPLDGWVLPLAPGLAPAVAAAALVLRTHSPVHGTGPAGEPAR